MSSTDTAPLARFRAAVAADADLEQRLATVADRKAFLALVADEAAMRGIPLGPPDVAAALAQDEPSAGPSADRMPGLGWLPAAVVEAGNGPAIDWVYLGADGLREPFFAQSVHRARCMPFGRLIRHRTPLAALPDAIGEAGAVPDGLIFHLSRCGSTLVAQMIAAMPETVVVSEAAPLDWVLRHAQSASHLPIAQRLALIRAMVAALGRRAPGGRGFVLKLDCWHTLMLPLLQQAFPETPWIFLYRDPVEIMASHVRQRGLHTIRGGIGQSVFGIVDAGLSEEAYCARVLAETCAPILAATDRSHGLLVNYAALPGAVATTILPHFDMRPDAAARLALAEAAGRNAKTPYAAFAPDSADKQRDAGPSVRAAVARYLAEPYRRLEMLRTGG